jgi:trans-aconitate methyltransferase
LTAEGKGRDFFAVDLGCGAGRDTAELLRRGWRVLAIDAEAEAIRRLLERRDLRCHRGESHSSKTPDGPKQT